MRSSLQVISSDDEYQYAVGFKSLKLELRYRQSIRTHDTISRPSAASFLKVGKLDTCLPAATPKESSMVLEARSLRKAAVPSTLIENPSPGNLQSTRLALHVFSLLDSSLFNSLYLCSIVMILNVSALFVYGLTFRLMRMAPLVWSTLPLAVTCTNSW